MCVCLYMYGCMVIYVCMCLCLYACLYMIVCVCVNIFMCVSSFSFFIHYLSLHSHTGQPSSTAMFCCLYFSPFLPKADQFVPSHLLRGWVHFSLGLPGFSSFLGSSSVPLWRSSPPPFFTLVHTTLLFCV